MLRAPPRVLVAAPAPRTTIDAIPLQVGLARWPAEPLFVTVVVKLTLSIEPTDDASVVRGVPAPAQDPLSLPVPSRLPGAAEDELLYPGDFSLINPGLVVAVTGHARCSAPQTRIDARLGFGGWGRSFTASAAAPVTAIPLTRAYTRTTDDPGVERPTRLPSDAVLDLIGLSSRGFALRLALPGLAPQLRWVDRAERRERLLPLACDTLWLDADASKLVLVHRCTVARTLFRDAYEGHLLVSLEREASPRSLSDLRGARVRGQLAHAVWAEEIAAGGPPPPSAEELKLARFIALDQAYEPLLPLAEYAAIAAELAEQRGPPGAILARSGLDEDTWIAEETAWLTRMGEAALGGDATLAASYGEHFARAQEALAQPGEEQVSAADYAEITAEIEAADDPAEVLRRRGLSLPVWLRLDRRWKQEAARDPRVADELEAQLGAARARYEGTPEG